MLIDTHAHVNFKAFQEDADAVIKRALDEDVWMVNAGTQIDTSRQAVNLAENFQFPRPTSLRRSRSGRAISNFQTNPKSKILNPKSGNGVYAVIGLHPVHTYSQHIDEEESSFQTREENFDYDAYRIMANHPKVVGIGECGLDYYRLPENNDRASVIENQKAAFIAQIKLAKELNKALVIHCRPSKGTQDAYEDILQILDREFENFQFPRPTSLRRSRSGRAISNFQFEIHSFTGSPEIAREFVRRGAYVGLNGIITFDKTGNMEKVVQAVPIERIVLETDCPYLTPIPHRGKRNEPSFVKFVAEKVARIKKISFNEAAEITSLNAKTLFLLP